MRVAEIMTKAVDLIDSGMSIREAAHKMLIDDVGALQR